MRSLLHLVDDLHLGGVKLHMETFQRREISSACQSSVELVRPHGRARKYSADVIIVHFTMNWRKLPFLITLRKMNPSARIVLEEHTYTRCFERTEVHNQRRFRRLLKLCYGLVDDVVAVSPDQASWLLQAGVVQPSRLQMIEMSRPLDGFEVLPLPSWYDDRPLRLGVIGRFAHEKGMSDAIDAMRVLDDRDFELFIAGYGPLEDELRERASGLSNVTFIGKASNPAAFVSSIDVLLMPSRREAFGLTCLEARAGGRPVIAYCVDGLRNQLKEGGGALVPPANSRALAGAILNLRHTELELMAQQARRTAQGSFERHVAAWKKFLAS